MNLQETYILNPAYALTWDNNRIVLTSFEHIDKEVGALSYNESTTSLIHPFNAQLLAFFDGSRNLDECIDAITSYFDLTREDVMQIVENFIENKEELHIVWDRQIINFPINILVPKGNLARRENYHPDLFRWNDNAGKVDLSYGRHSKPLNITLELTMKCYTNCIYCYADRSHVHDEELLPLARICDIIRECRRIGVVNIAVNGGEVLMHPHWQEIFTELRRNGYNALISTKKPIPISSLRFLKEIGMTNLQLSIDSLNPATLHKMVGSGPGYIEALRKTMSDLDELGFQWQVHTILTRYNSDLETEIKPLVKELLRYKNIRSYRVDPAGYSLYKTAEHYNSIKAPLADVTAIDHFLEKLASRIHHLVIGAGKAVTNDDLSIEEKKSEFSARSICSGNQSSMVVLPDGKVTICEELYWHPRFLIGDLKKQSILEVWNSDEAKGLYNLSQTKLDRQSACSACKDFSSCRSFPGTCWKTTLMAYGRDKWDYPDPSCPYAPEPVNEWYLQ